MPMGRTSGEIKRIRNEVLVTLSVVYPAALTADQVLRSLLVLVPDLEFDRLRRDLHYLIEKHYIERVVPGAEHEPELTPWRKRWFRLTTSGMEVAEQCVRDPALEES